MWQSNDLLQRLGTAQSLNRDFLPKKWLARQLCPPEVWSTSAVCNASQNYRTNHPDDNRSWDRGIWWNLGIIPEINSFSDASPSPLVNVYSLLFFSHGPVEIVDLPIQNGGSFHGYVKLPDQPSNGEVRQASLALHLHFWTDAPETAWPAVILKKFSCSRAWQDVTGRTSRRGFGGSNFYGKTIQIRYIHAIHRDVQWAGPKNGESGSTAPLTKLCLLALKHLEWSEFWVRRAITCCSTILYQWLFSGWWPWVATQSHVVPWIWLRPMVGALISYWWQDVHMYMSVCNWNAWKTKHNMYI